MRRFLAAVAFAFLLAGPSVVPAEAASKPSISLVEQTPWVNPGGTIRFRLTTKGSTDGLEIRAVAHQAVSTRGGFDQTLAGKSLGGVVNTVNADLVTLPVDESGARIFDVATQDPAASRDPARLNIRRSGVYPTELVLANIDTGKKIDSVLTYSIVLTPDAAPTRLKLAWIWRMYDRPQSPNTDRLATMLRAIPGSIQINTAPSPERLAALGERSDLASFMPSLSAGTNQVISGPYVPIDPPSLASAGLSSAIRDSMTKGSDSLRETIGARPDTRTQLFHRLDTDSFAELRGSGVDQFILDPESFSNPVGRFTVAAPFTVLSGNSKASALMNDVGLASTLSDAESSALAAQRFVAGTTLVSLESPATQRGLVVAMPDDWEPNPTAISYVANALTAHPSVAPTTVADIFANVPVERSGSPIIRKLANSDSNKLFVSKAQYDEAIRFGRDLSSVFGSDDKKVKVAVDSTINSLSDQFVGPRAEHRASSLVETARLQTIELSKEIQAPQGKTVTLTSRSSVVPITFLNATGRPATVRVKYESSNLLFPDGQESIVTLPPKSSTHNVRVEARGTGRFSMRISVTSPNRHLEIQQARLNVSSNAINEVGVVLTVGAATFLALWWGGHFLRSKRKLKLARQQVSEKSA